MSEMTALRHDPNAWGQDIADSIWSVLWLDHTLDAWAEPDHDMTEKSPKWRKFTPELRDA
jgi:hypothetical protein